MEKLKKLLKRIDYKGYKAYKDIEGVYTKDPFLIIIEHVQGDPFASPSNIVVKIGYKNTGFPDSFIENEERKIALADFIHRKFESLIKNVPYKIEGTGNSGKILIAKSNQYVYPKSACIVGEKSIELRFNIGLPASGRKILGIQALNLIEKNVIFLLENSLFAEFYDLNKVEEHLKNYEIQQEIREKLGEMGLVAFVGNGSILPRKNGIVDIPMEKEKVILFRSPESLEVEIETRYGKFKGMGIKEGVTLIIGGGFHGKSTLLKAIERGVYSKIKGDGRELCVTREDAFKVRAEDGRFVYGVDISSFLTNLPSRNDSSFFITENASGSTSQAANIVEAIEVGSKLLLIDEDTSATNFMIRDEVMKKLVSKENEPITPFIDRIDELYKNKKISTILVMGGSSDYIKKADTIIQMLEFKPIDITKEAKEVYEVWENSIKSTNKNLWVEEEKTLSPFNFTRRKISKKSIEPKRKGKKLKINAKSIHVIRYGLEEIDMDYVEQVVDPMQLNFIADAIYSIYKNMNNYEYLDKLLYYFGRDFRKYGFKILSPYPNGNYAYARKYEIAAAINRLRTLIVKKEDI